MEAICRGTGKLVWITQGHLGREPRELALAGDYRAGGFLVAYRFYGAFLATQGGRTERRRITRPPTASATTWTTNPRGGWCCSASTSPPSPGRDRWSVRCWPRNGDTSRASPGSSLGPAWPAASTILWSCWPRCGRMGCRCPRSPANLLGPVGRGRPPPWPRCSSSSPPWPAWRMVVVNALSESPWGMFTILVTIPAALITGPLDEQDPPRAGWARPR